MESVWNRNSTVEKAGIRDCMKIIRGLKKEEGYGFFFSLKRGWSEMFGRARDGLLIAQISI